MGLGAQPELFTVTPGSPWRFQLGPTPTNPQLIHKQKHSFLWKEKVCPSRTAGRYTPIWGNHGSPVPLKSCSPHSSRALGLTAESCPCYNVAANRPGAHATPSTPAAPQARRLLVCCPEAHRPNSKLQVSKLGVLGPQRERERGTQPVVFSCT